MELVVKQPRHPYTQLLISSIPLASAKRSWTSDTVAAPAIPAAGQSGCKFADRCPFATSPCLQAPPALFQTDRHRAVACYLHKGAPPLSSEALGQVFAAPARLEQSLSGSLQ